MNHSEMLALLQPDIEKIDQAMRADLAAGKDPKLAEVVEYAIFNGGKRIRPLLALLSARLCGCEDAAIYRLAISLEYLHTATLLHDDVIDHAEQRRGRPAANIKWNDPVAILAGDYLHARSMFLVGMEGGRQCLDIICQASAAMVEGEFLQMNNALNSRQTAELYYRIITRKTAFLIAAACEIGAAFAKASPGHRQALRSYGLHLGLAFQVVDDLLDYLGDTRRTGKDIGNDFCEGKITLPLIHALAAAAADDRSLIEGLLHGNSGQRRPAIAAVRSVIDKYQGFAYARQQAGSLVDAAIVDLEKLDQDLNPQAYSILAALSQYVLTREK